MFVHEDPEFHQLLSVASQARSLTIKAVASDYWAVHALWALQQQGFEVLLRAGFTLSKGFGLITRPSACLDLWIAPGRTGIATPHDWRGRSETAAGERRSYLEAVKRLVRVPGASIEWGEIDAQWRSAKINVKCSSASVAEHPHAEDLALVLAVHDAWFKPCVLRPLRAFVHDELERLELTQAFEDNRPSVQCVHPLVTLLEKLDVLQRVVPRREVPANQFVRHFADAAAIIHGADRLPALAGYTSVFELASDMLADQQLSALPSSFHEALNPDAGVRWRELHDAYEQQPVAIGKSRLSLEAACRELCSWIDANVG